LKLYAFRKGRGRQLIHGDITDEERYDPQSKSCCSWGGDDGLGDELELVVEVEMKEELGGG